MKVSTQSVFRTRAANSAITQPSWVVHWCEETRLVNVGNLIQPSESEYMFLPKCWSVHYFLNSHQVEEQLTFRHLKYTVYWVTIYFTFDGHKLKSASFHWALYFVSTIYNNVQSGWKPRNSSSGWPLMIWHTWADAYCCIRKIFKHFWPKRPECPQTIVAAFGF